MWFLAGVCLLGVLGYVLYYVRRLTHEATIGKSTGCQSPQDYPHLDKIWGLDFIFTLLVSMGRTEAIPAAVRFHRDCGSTFRVRALGKSIFYTIDPENLRTVYDSSSQDWGVSPQRLKALQPFCGTGFITADGSAWQHSNAMLKPYLSSSNVGDHELFTSAIDRFVAQFPADGQTTDMSPTLDEFVSKKKPTTLYFQVPTITIDSS